MEFERRKQEEIDRKEKERNKQILDSNIIAQVVEAQKGKKRKVHVQKDSNVVSRRASSQTMLPKVVKDPVVKPLVSESPRSSASFKQKQSEAQKDTEVRLDSSIESSDLINKQF